MKKLVMIGLLLTQPIMIMAELGCMENSYHTKEPYDYKNYHYVDCTCPCTRQQQISAVRGICSECGHCRDPQETRRVSNYDAQPKRWQQRITKALLAIKNKNKEREKNQRV